MEQIVKDITGLVGGTPLLEAARFGQARGLSARLLCKLEYLNPTGSVKDRAALWMLEAAEREGRLAPGATIIEPTSGNTGIGLAAIGASRGYRVILTMPETMSRERRDLLKAYGAQIVLTPGDKGMDGAMQKAAELAASLPGSFIPGQFENPHNAQAHYESTGPELWEQAGGALDAFVAGIGTGGTLTGTGRFLREKNPDIALVGVEPAGSPVLTQGKAGPHGLQGIGAGFVPQVLDTGLYDEILPCTEEDAYAAARELEHLPPITVYEPTYVERPPEVDMSEPLEITHEDDTWLVEGPWLQRLMANVNFGDYESRNWFDRMLRQSGLFDRLEEMGIQDGDIVSLYNLEFEYQR